MTDITIRGLTPADIEQLRAVMDNLPLNPYAPMFTKVLKALPGGLERSLMSPLPEITVEVRLPHGHTF